MKFSAVLFLAGITGSITGVVAQTCPLYAVTVTPPPVYVTVTANATTITAPRKTSTITVPCPAQICRPQTCGNFVQRCNPRLDCWCGPNAEGGTFCFQNAWCRNLKTCNTTRDCPQGTQCLVKSCCGVSVCASSSCTSPGPVKRSLGGVNHYDKRQNVAQEDSMAFAKGSVIPPFEDTADPKL